MLDRLFFSIRADTWRRWCPERVEALPGAPCQHFHSLYVFWVLVLHNFISICFFFLLSIRQCWIDSLAKSRIADAGTFRGCSRKAGAANRYLFLWAVVRGECSSLLSRLSVLRREQLVIGRKSRGSLAGGCGDSLWERFVRPRIGEARGRWILCRGRTWSLVAWWHFIRRMSKLSSLSIVFGSCGRQMCCQFDWKWKNARFVENASSGYSTYALVVTP